MLIQSLRSIADELPFHLDDIAEANATFVRWHQHRSDTARRLVDIWTYCYVYRYFLAKFATSARRDDGTLDDLVGRAFRDVQRHIPQIRQPERYTHFVSKVCRNTFVNHLRNGRTYVSLEDGTLTLRTTTPQADHAYDLMRTYQVALRAIHDLPDYLRDIARMRLIENSSYEEIEAATGHPVPTLRSYVNKTLRRLRTHPELCALAEELSD
jgi:RNA polymerase sigma-70 factor (ECF subfamily)